MLPDLTIHRGEENPFFQCHLSLIPLYSYFLSLTVGRLGSVICSCGPRTGISPRATTWAVEHNCSHPWRGGDMLSATPSLQANPMKAVAAGRTGAYGKRDFFLVLVGQGTTPVAASCRNW